MKNTIFTLAATIVLTFAANAHIVVMGGTRSVTTTSSGTTKIKCGRDQNAICCIIGDVPDNPSMRVAVTVNGRPIFGSKYERAGGEIIVHP